MDIHNPKCFANHLGLYAIEPDFLIRAVKLIKNGTWKVSPIKALKADEEDAEEKLKIVSDQDRTKKPNDYFGNVGYAIYDGGLCVISLSGPSMKGRSKFDGFSTIDARRALNYALKDPSCSSIMLLIDSPGGTTAGTQELAEAVKAADQSKPVHAHIDDMGASAAYWIASQARKVTANATALVGSIGTYSVIEDTSKKAEMKGVKVHVISSGGVKGGTADGAPVKQDVLDHWQKIVDESTEHFIAAVASGRGMSKKAVAELADGRVHLADAALKMGLIDEVASSDMVATAMSKKYAPKPASNKARTKAEEADALMSFIENDL